MTDVRAATLALLKELDIDPATVIDDNDGRLEVETTVHRFGTLMNTSDRQMVERVLVVPTFAEPPELRGPVRGVALTAEQAHNYLEALGELPKSFADTSVEG